MSGPRQQCPNCSQARPAHQFVTFAGNVMRTCEPCRAQAKKTGAAPGDAITREEHARREAAADRRRQRHRTR